MTQHDFTLILIAGVGAVAQEFLHWYNLRTQLSNRRYSKVLRSPLYWAMVAGMTLLSGVFAWVWYQGDGVTHLPREYFLTGAAFPLILKKAAEAAAANTAVKLGEGDGSTLNDYLLIRPTDTLTKEAGHE